MVVAGMRVGMGELKKNHKFQVVRKDEVIHTGTVESMRILKKDVELVAKGLECGLGLLVPHLLVFVTSNHSLSGIHGVRKGRRGALHQGGGGRQRVCRGGGSTPLVRRWFQGHCTFVNMASSMTSELARVVQQLLAQHAAEDHKGRDTEAALYHAAKGGHVEWVQLLLKGVGDVNWRAPRRATALFAAARGGHAECVRVLLAAGANVELGASDEGKRPLYIAACKGHLDCVRVLVEQGHADVRATDARGFTALDGAAKHGKTEAARLLLDMGAEMGRTVLLMAACEGHVECAAMLIDGGSRVDAVDANGCTVLHHSVKANRMDVVKLLLARGANVNAFDKNGFSPLVVAIYGGNVEMMELLLAAGANPDGVVANSTTSFIYLFIILNSLLEKCTNPLLATAAKGYTDCMAVLLKHGSDDRANVLARVNAVDKRN